MRDRWPSFSRLGSSKLPRISLLWQCPSSFAGNVHDRDPRFNGSCSPSCVFERLPYPRNSTSPWFTASCCSDGSLTVVQPLWFQNLPNLHRCLKWEGRQLTQARTGQAMQVPVWRGSAGRLTLLEHPRMAVFILILLVTYIRQSELLTLRKKGLVPPLVPLLKLVGRDLSFRNWSVYHDRSPRRVGPHGPALASIGQQALARTQGKNLEEKTWNFDYPAAAIFSRRKPTHCDSAE